MAKVSITVPGTIRSAEHTVHNLAVVAVEWEQGVAETGERSTDLTLQRDVNMKQKILEVLAAGVVFLAGCATNPSRHDGSVEQSEPAKPAKTRPRDNSPNPVVRFWFEYNAEPNPGQRVWMRVDNSTWVELYPNGTQSRYQTKERAVVGQGLRGTVVRKVAGDPRETWTLNDASFEVFIPDKENPRLILAFRHFQNGQWTEWQLLAIIHPIE